MKEEREIRLSKLKENIEALEKAKAREEEGKSEELHDYGNEEEKQEWMKAKTQKRYSRKEHHSRSRSRSHNSHNSRSGSRSRSHHHHHRHHRHHRH